MQRSASPRLQRLLTGALALAAGLIAGEASAQDAGAAPPPCLTVEQQPQTPAPALRGAPVMDAFTRFDEAPLLRNREEMAAALEREYPQANRAAGIGGQTYLWILIDADGIARAAQVNISSGCPELDEAALRAAEVMRFSPAVREGKATAVWVPVAIDFDPALEARRGPSETPEFTPFTVAPVMQNRGEVADALRREYPPSLRAAGVRGRTIVWIQLDSGGTIRDVQINTGSGHEQLDEAALRVARIFRFTPAQNEGRPVPVWIAVPVQFEP